MTPTRVLVVEDDAAMGSQLVVALQRAGMAPVRVGSVAAAAAVAVAEFDVVLLDIGLPDGDGDLLLQRWAAGLCPPVIVLSARTDLRTRLVALGQGAVDFMPKPFWMDELLLRIGLRLRLRSPTTLQIADVEVDLECGSLRRGEERQHLTPAELAALGLLVHCRGRAVSRAQLAAAIGGDDLEAPADRTVDSHISRLRRKLGATAAGWVHTIAGRGYRFEAPEGGGA